MTEEALRRACAERFLEREPAYEEDIHASRAVAQLVLGQVREANRGLRRAALYMDLPHPTGRDPRGEADFAAMGLIAALYMGEDKLEPETRRLIKRFFLDIDFTSIYGSENHVFMMRVTRFLAAHFYKEDFRQFRLSWQEAARRDKAYLIEFIRFRAQYGIGEFTSAYLAVDLRMASLLENYSPDPEIKEYGRLFGDLCALEAFNNYHPKGSLCGAVGRTYPDTYLYPCCNVPKRFDDMLVKGIPGGDLPEFIGSPHHVDGFVLDTIRKRHLPCEIRERKHLHSMNAWRTDVPDHARLDRLFAAGSISKYTYLCDEYGIGAIQHQDAYPQEDDTDDPIYAHHQQVEWACHIISDEEEKNTHLFSSHPGTFGEHNKWTGDLKCCCVHTYATRDTAMAIYNIEKEDQLDYTHLFIEPEKYLRMETEEHYIFLESEKCYIAVYIANPFTVGKDEQYGCGEVVSPGRQNAYALRIVRKAEADTFEAFRDNVRAIPVRFDRDAVRLTFGDLFLDEQGNGKVGKPEVYPYPNVYDAPWVQSVWGEGVVRISGDGKHAELDFVNGTVREA